MEKEQVKLPKPSFGKLLRHTWFGLSRFRNEQLFPISSNTWSCGKLTTKGVSICCP